MKLAYVECMAFQETTILYESEKLRVRGLKLMSIGSTRLHPQSGTELDR